MQLGQKTDSVWGITLSHFPDPPKTMVVCYMNVVDQNETNGAFRVPAISSSGANLWRMLPEMLRVI